MNKQIKAVRGSIFHFLTSPFTSDESESYQYFEDGLLFIQSGYVHKVGAYDDLKNELQPETELTEYQDGIILPGFIDSHLHYPQTDIIASYGEQLLTWLETYTFPCEGKLKDPEYAESVVDFFLTELLRNGTTTAQVMPTVHKHSAEIFFKKAEERNLRMICGKVMMDRNAPDYLLDTPEKGYEESAELIEEWHGKGRLSYAVSPRFAVTSTEEQLKKTADLLDMRPDLYLHTHLSENRREVSLISELFPWSKDYLNVYENYNLVRERSTFAHCIYLHERNYENLAANKAAISFCPTSNLFIGSGLFDLNKPIKHNVRLSIGTDIGGGTSFSILRTLGEAYKVLQLNSQKLSALKAFYLATLGGAEALCLNEKIGNFVEGKEADFCVLDMQATPLMQRRNSEAKSIEDKLFIAMTLGDDRNIKATHIMGECIYTRD